MSLPAGQHTVRTDDGVALAVRRSGTPGRPVLVCVHGYPDDSSVWAGVAGALADDFDIVTYDVRGAGASGRPRRRAAYRLDRLAADLRTVVDLVSPTAPVHLLAHDWGSIQAFYALPRTLRGRALSYTSISGPDLDAARGWLRAQLRGGPRGWRLLARQMTASGYIGAFLLPGPADLAVRIGFVARVVARDPSRRGQPVARADLRDGLKLYRANMLRRPERAHPPLIDVPVQVVVARGDRYVGSGMQTNLDSRVADLRVVLADSGHWLPIEDPHYLAERVRDFAAELAGH